MCVNLNHVDDVELIDVVIGDGNFSTLMMLLLAMKTFSTLLIVQVLPISPSRLLKGP